MQIQFCVRSNTLILYLIGEMDHLSAPEARKKCDKIIDENAVCDKAIIDLSAVQFMDSTGIGFLIGRYKKLLRFQIPLFIANPTPSADKVLDLSGIYTIIPKQ